MWAAYIFEFETPALLQPLLMLVIPTIPALSILFRAQSSKDLDDDDDEWRPFSSSSSPFSRNAKPAHMEINCQLRSYLSERKFSEFDEQGTFINDVTI